ncbi:MAG: helix-turn-helix transcriptional regulator [Sinimarinibacterium sp.]
MGWIETSRDTQWIGALYRQANVFEGAALKQWALDRLSEQVPFSAAAWCTRRNDGDRLTAIAARGLPAPALEPLLALGVRLWRRPQASGDRPVATVAPFDLSDLATRQPRASELCAQGLSHAFVALCPQRGTLFTTVLCLLRTSTQSPFSHDECARLGALLPHLAEAETLELEQRICLDQRLARAGRRNRSPGGLIDDSGAVRAMCPGFRELLCQRLPHWDGLRVPTEMIVEPEAGGGARNVTLAELGLHARCSLAADNLFEVHVRPTHPFDRLTEREHDIVKAIVDGESYKLVARRLGVSPSTVANHASNIYRKLGALNRDQVVVLASSFLGEDEDRAM